MQTGISQQEADEILDIDISSLADMPGFDVVKAGTHKMYVQLIPKKINGVQAVEVSTKLIETLELADALETPDVPGLESAMLCQLDNEFGQGSLKAVTAPLSELTGKTKIREINEAIAGMEFIVTTKQRAGKGDKKDNVYLQIVSLKAA